MPGDAHPRGERQSSSTEALCVLWHPRGAGPDPDLLHTLGRKGFRTVVCDNAVEATAWICSTAAPTPRGGGAAPSPRPLVLLMDRPGLLRGAAEVQETVERYAPRAACWSHDPTATPRLRATLSPRAATQPPPRQGSDEAPVAHTLRLAGEGPEIVVPMSVMAPDPEISLPPAPAATPTQRPLRDLLTDDELAMLLDGAGPITEQSPHSLRPTRS